MGDIFRKIILIFGDLCCIQFATFLAMLIESSSMRGMQIDFHLRLTVLLSVFLIFFFNIYGLFSLVRKRLTEIFLNLIVAVINIFIAAMAVTFFMREFEYSRFVIIYSAVFGFILLMLWQYLMHKIEVKHLPIPTVFIAAWQDEQQKLKTKIRKTYGLEKSTLKFANADEENKLNEAETKKQIESSDIVLIGESLPVEQKEHIFRLANEKMKMVILVPTLYEISCSKMYLWQIDDLPTQRVSRMLLTLEQRALKRTLDIVVATIAILILWPVMLITAVIVKLDSPGSAIYSQVRVGRFGKEFKVTRERIRQIEAKALRKLKHPNRSKKLADFME